MNTKQFTLIVLFAACVANLFAQGNVSFPDDPGVLTYSLNLSAAVVDGDMLDGYAPTGAGGYAAGTSVTITAQNIPGYEFVRWSDGNTENPRSYVVSQSISLTAYYNRKQIEIAVAGGGWTFICLPPLGDRQYTADMFTYDGLSNVKWGTYNGSKRAMSASGWETPDTYNAQQGYIIYSTTAGTLRINAYEDEIPQSAVSSPLSAYQASHPENANWNFLGNPYNYGFDIAGLAAAGIEAPVTVWNGTAYSTYTPGVDEYIFQPFEAFFIQKAEGGAEAIEFAQEYLIGYEIPRIEGELSGAFSVSATTQIHFSKGNLQYVGTWQFAENQWDYFGENQYGDHRDLFGWGTGDAPNKVSQDDNDYSTFVDWGSNAITNGGNTANQWRTLNKDEWAYLFLNRANAATLFGMGRVNGVNGTILLPDNWVLPNGVSFTASTTQGLADLGTGGYCNSNGNIYSHNTYSAEQWASMESAGAVFFPASGSCEGTNAFDVDLSGYYWSATPNETSSAYSLYFDTNCISPQSSSNRFRGQSVRLVR